LDHGCDAGRVGWVKLAIEHAPEAAEEMTQPAPRPNHRWRREPQRRAESPAAASAQLLMETAAVGVGGLPASRQAVLVMQAAAGDGIAFEELVALTADRTFRIARAILGDESDARDATQDAYVSAWRDLPRLRNHEMFDAWLRRIVVNACRATLRGRRRIREIRLDPQIEPQGEGPSLAESVGDTDLLSRAFDRLDADKRTLLVLHYLNHEPVATIAGALGIPVGTAKWRLSDARVALQRALIAEGAPRS
jgi:RNA polymerase sigma-70 factor, ECF subfamily